MRLEIVELTAVQNKFGGLHLTQYHMDFRIVDRMKPRLENFIFMPAGSIESPDIFDFNLFLDSGDVKYKRLF